MRDYGTVSPRFWTGETGKSLRGHPESQIVAMYLMTSPHSTSTGVFHCPRIYISHETGLPAKGVTKGLRRLIEVGFCEYEEASEAIFVRQMARWQIADTLQPTDNRVAWLKKEVQKMPGTRMVTRFLEVYGKAFCLVGDDWEPTPSEGASHPLGSQDLDKDLDRDMGKRPPSNGKAGKLSQLPDDFTLTPAMAEYAEQKLPDVDVPAFFESFTGYTKAHAKKYADWPAAFQNFVRNAVPGTDSFASGKYPRRAGRKTASVNIGGREWAV